MLSNEEAKNRLRELLHEDTSRLFNWEIDFLENIDGLDKFSDRQKEKIEEIWDRFNGGE